MAARCQPAVEQARVGGDWYDAFALRDGSLLVTVGDVIGHDGTAAAAMAQLRNMLRGIAYTVDQSPAAILAALDDAMTGLGTRSFATAVIARIHDAGTRIDPDATRRRRVTTYANAGHPRPVLRRPGGRTVLLPGGVDLPLGVDVDRSRHDHTVELLPGSALVLYTDGLIERRTAVDITAVSTR